MDTEFMSENCDKEIADMQMSIANELKEIKADILTGKNALKRIDRLIYELEEDAKIAYQKFEVLEGGKNEIR